MPCRPHYAYLYPDTDVATARASEHYRSVLRPASREWLGTQLPQGALLTLPGGEPRLGLYGAPIEAEGEPAHFLPPPDLPWLIDTAAWRELLRAAHPPATCIDLLSGHTISLALGLAAPSSVIVGGGTGRIGDPVTELGQLAWQTYDEYQAAQRGEAELPADDTGRLAWLCFLAVQAIYHLTTDMFNASAIITTADLYPALTAIWGGDPKASPAADATSASSAAGSSPSP